MNSKFASILIAAAFSATTLPGFCGTDSKDELSPTVAPEKEPSIPISQEFTLEGGWSGRSTVKQGNAKLGGVSTANGHFNYVASPTIHEGLLLRFGVDAERFSFSLPPHAPLPNTLQSFSAIFGADMSVGDKIIMRAEIHPGVYSDFDHLTASDIDAPVQIGGTYLYSKDLQFIFGIQIDLKSSLPLIGVPGVRWQFADHWVLSAIPPKPRIEYEFSNALTLYVGANILAGTYRLNDTFGVSHGHGAAPNNEQFNNNIIEFTEVRLGGGVVWKFIPNMSLDVSAGYMPYRNFNIHPDRIGFDVNDTTFKNSLDHGAPYAEAGIHGSF